MIKLFAKNIEVYIDGEKRLICSVKINGTERSKSETPIFKIRFRDLDGKTYLFDSTQASSMQAYEGKLIFKGFSDIFHDTFVTVYVPTGT